MQIVYLCLELIDYINQRLNVDDLGKREVNNLKMLKALVCDFVMSDIQKRKERIYVPDGTKPCINYDFNDSQQGC